MQESLLVALYCLAPIYDERLVGGDDTNLNYISSVEAVRNYLRSYITGKLNESRIGNQA